MKEELEKRIEELKEILKKSRWGIDGDVISKKLYFLEELYSALYENY